MIVRPLLVGMSVFGLLVSTPGWAQDADARLDLPGSPTDRILTAPEIKAHLTAQLEELSACFRSTLAGHDPGDLTLAFRVMRNGQADSISIDGIDLPAKLTSCITTAIQQTPFPSHDGDPVDAAWPLIWISDIEGARLEPYPVVWIRQRPAPLPFIVWPTGFGLEPVLSIEAVLYGREPPQQNDQQSQGIESPSEPAGGEPSQDEPERPPR